MLQWAVREKDGVEKLCGDGMHQEYLRWSTRRPALGLVKRALGRGCVDDSGHQSRGHIAGACGAALSAETELRLLKMEGF